MDPPAPETRSSALTTHGALSPRPARTRRPTPLALFIRRLTFLLSLILGTSSLFALFVSTFLLPLLHASYSARNTVAELQRSRFQHLLEGIRGLRSRKTYAAADNPTEAENDEKTVLFEEIESGASSPPRAPPSSLNPISEFRDLQFNLTELASAVDATSTTRTSLLSTLEGYTSDLQDEVYATPSSRRNGVLGEPKSRDPAVDVRAEEWDAVRKEVRSIKGLLLNRRSLAPVAVANGGDHGS